MLYFLLPSFIVAFLLSWVVAGCLVAPAHSLVTSPIIDLPLKTIKLASESGSILSGWHIHSKEAKGVVILLHGIRATRLSMLKRAEFLYEEGYSVILIDFQAHGESSGDHITVGYLEKYDVLTTIKYAKAQYSDEPVGIIGVSLGGASALLASPQDIDALIIESVYLNIRTAVYNRVKQRLGIFSLIPTELLLAQLKPRLGINASMLSPVSYIDSITCPIYIISGMADRYTTQRETEVLYANAQQPKKLWLLPDIGHEDIYKASPTLYKENIITFFKNTMKKNDKIQVL